MRETFAHFLNTVIENCYIKKWVTKNWRRLSPLKQKIFEIKGEGIYYVTFAQAPSDKVSKLIAKISGGVAHVFPVLYTKNLREWFTEDQWRIVEKKWKFYYGSLRGLKCCTTFVLGSADATGMNFFDYSEYQSRVQTIRFVPLSQIQIWFLIQNVILRITACYDFVGLIGWPFHLYSKNDLYCSEYVYDLFQTLGISVAERKLPSPTQIERYNRNLIVYTDMIQKGKYFL